MADQLIERYQKQPCFIGYNNVMSAVMLTRMLI